MIEQIGQQLGIKLPKDLSPVERAKLKLYWHAGIIALFNGLLAGIVLLNQNSVITWNTVLWSLAGQIALAAVDVAKKYVSASGDISLETILNVASNYVSSRIPAVALPAQAQELQQAFSNVVNSAPPVSVQFQTSVPGTAIPNLSIPIVSTPIQAAPVAPVSDHPSMDNVATQNTLPNIAAIKQP